MDGGKENYAWFLLSHCITEQHISSWEASFPIRPDDDVVAGKEGCLLAWAAGLSFAPLGPTASLPLHLGPRPSSTNSRRRSFSAFPARDTPANPYRRGMLPPPCPLADVVEPNERRGCRSSRTNGCGLMPTGHCRNSPFFPLQGFCLTSTRQPPKCRRDNDCFSMPVSPVRLSSWQTASAIVCCRD